MIVQEGKFQGVSLSAIPTEDLSHLAFEARRARDRRLLRAIESEIARRGRRREQTRLLRSRYPRSSA